MTPAQEESRPVHSHADDVFRPFSCGRCLALGYRSFMEGVTRAMTPQQPRSTVSAAGEPRTEGVHIVVGQGGKVMAVHATRREAEEDAARRNGHIPAMHLYDYGVESWHVQDERNLAEAAESRPSVTAPGSEAAAASPLDVPMLAEALNATVGKYGWARSTPADPVEEWMVNAARVAAEYTRLSRSQEAVSPPTGDET